MTEAHDIVIMGAGPAGAACGTFLARHGLDVLLIDAEKHPRHHIGESLLAASMPLLADLGISMEEMTRRFQPKFGARFYDPALDRLATFEFETAPGSPSPSFQALREDLDEMLAANAIKSGCTLAQNEWIESVEEDAERPTLRLRSDRELSCRFLVDATGRQPLLAAKRRTRQILTDYGRVGIYNYFTHLPPHDDFDDKYITMYIFEQGWVWFIPLRDGRTSVGVVYRTMPEIPPSSGQSRTESLFWHAVKTMPRLEQRLRAARPSDPFRAISDYSFSVSEKFGGHPNAGWAAIGDAAGFLDPIFSSGVHLALASAQRASAGILEKLRTGSDRGLHEYAAHMNQGFHVFRAFVHRFYNRDLVNNIFFMPNKPPAIHAAITNILAGHVWDPANPVLKMIGAGNPAVSQPAVA
ncbi:MAG: NAD(P)/FAD-dependent oxidoreductase [Phycisphaerae bacterium]